eukprot:SAG31_NODE_533_length_14371_cov_6.455367_12_plen_129_part_00
MAARRAVLPPAGDGKRRRARGVGGTLVTPSSRLTGLRGRAALTSDASDSNDVVDGLRRHIRDSRVLLSRLTAHLRAADDEIAAIHAAIPKDDERRLKMALRTVGSELQVRPILRSALPEACGVLFPFS